jgi:hypothetical protein
VVNAVDLHPRRVRYAAALAFVCSALAACATIAEVDVAYSPATAGDGGPPGFADGSRIVRDSTVETSRPVVVPLPPGPGTPCNGNLGADAECDDTAGMGCCLTGGASLCLFQWERETKCSAPSVFVACRQSTDDAPCCWRKDKVGNPVAMFAADCDGGLTACVAEAGCSNGQTCVTRTCPGDPLEIGACGQAPKCPNE